MQRQIQVFWCEDVEVIISERVVGTILIGYIAEFKLNGKYHKLYGVTSTKCWVDVCKRIRGVM